MKSRSKFQIQKRREKYSARALLYDGSSFAISLTHAQRLQDGEDVTQSSTFALFRFTFIATVTPLLFLPRFPPPHNAPSLLHSSLQFLAEWGDRSQIATIALAAKNEPFGTTIGGIIGHAMCTGAAVLGGKVLSEKISKKAVLFIGAGELNVLRSPACASLMSATMSLNLSFFTCRFVSFLSPAAGAFIFFGVLGLWFGPDS